MYMISESASPFCGNRG